MNAKIVHNTTKYLYIEIEIEIQLSTNTSTVHYRSLTRMKITFVDDCCTTEFTSVLSN